MANEELCFVVLLRGSGAETARERLRQELGPEADSVLEFPPMVGLDFFTCEGGRAEQLDRWWEQEVGSKRPVVLLMAEPDLAEWLSAPIDADFIVGVSPEEEALYSELDRVTAVVTDDPQLLADAALHTTGKQAPEDEDKEGAPSTPPPAPSLPSPQGGVIDNGTAPSGEEPPVPVSEAENEEEEDEASQAPPAPAPAGGYHDNPFELLAEVPALYAQDAPLPVPLAKRASQFSSSNGEGSASLPQSSAPSSSPSSTPAASSPPPPPPASGFSTSPPPPGNYASPSGAHPPPPPKPPTGMLPESMKQAFGAGQPPANPWSAPPAAQRTVSRRSVTGAKQGNFSFSNVFGKLSSGGRREVSQELGNALVSRRPPMMISVVSRKGGVGKTASAAAIAAIFGEAVDGLGATACLIDANIGNPDAWGRLDIRGPAPTMREIITQLMNGEEPSPAAHAQTPALAVYPESRDAGDGYAPAQIQRVATYLRTHHAGVVVDLPNRLPAFTSAEAAIAAAWIAESDVVVLPTTADPAAMTAVLEYIATESLHGKPVVVPYIVPRLKEVRNAPEIRELLEEVRVRCFAVVDIPDDDRATLALIRHQAITEISPQLRQAYLRLAETVIHASVSPRPATGAVR